MHEISVKEIFEGYKDSADNGVVGYSGKLNIRPPYQREFVYKDSQRDAVIDTVRKGFPLNVMYWVKNDSDEYEVLDGQQRTISICQYLMGDFSIKVDNNPMYFHNLTKDEQDAILNYTLMIYICEGTDREKLEWFKTINIAGEKLTNQELRNAVYVGEWLTDAKRYFSKKNCAAYNIGKDYIKGAPERQEYLETAIKWISDGNIEGYMSEHQHDLDANKLWLYFLAVINWTKAIFPDWHKEMKGVDWGSLYNQFEDKTFNVEQLKKEVSRLLRDEDVTKKPGIYPYLLTGEEKWLSIRTFATNMKREAYERQEGICPHCKGSFEIEEMEADHITPWHLGGKTTADNCQMLCKKCNRKKGGK